MNKKLFNVFFLLLGVFSTSIFYNTVANASPEGTKWSGSCSQPYSRTAYEKKPEFGYSEKTGNKHWHTPNHSNDIQLSKPPWVIHNDYNNEHNQTVYEECSNTSYSTGTAYSGTITHHVTYYSSGVSNAYQTHKEYYVTSVSISVSKTYSKVDESLPTFSCTAYYPDGTPKNCTGKMYVSKDKYTNNNTVREICYKYTDNSRSDEKCTTRVYVSSVSITAGPAHTYTGMRHTYKCEAKYGDGSTNDISTLKKVWSSTPSNYIGENYGGYTDPRGTKHTAGANNIFYPADINGRQYGIKCAYYQETPKYNTWISDPSNVKTTTKYVTHHGIKEMKVEASGYFLSGPAKYQYAGNILPDKSTSYYPNRSFIRGHWYDFKSYIMYDDGTNGSGGSGWRNITNAPEVYWTYSPEYKAKKTYDTNMNKSGEQHRMSQNGKNTITSSYFHTGSAVNNKSKFQAFAWTHEIIDLKIKGPGGENDPPKIKVKGDETVNYTAWITWSDETTNPFNQGKKEDWTKAVVWEGDDMIGTGKYKFPRGKGEKRTITAYYADYDSLKGSYKVWDKALDKLEITIEDDCNDIKYNRWGCDVPKDVWQVSGFESKQENYLPPPDIFGFAEWNDETSPYIFTVEFPVTGISNGVGFN